jgi:hypothetical protein
MHAGKYKQAFVVTMENGAIILAVVMGEDVRHGEGLAISDAKEIMDRQVWSSQPYPALNSLDVGAKIILPPCAEWERKFHAKNN